MIRYAAVFPGQGSQYPGMAEEICAASPAAAALYAEAAQVLGYDLRAASDDVDRLADTRLVQPAVLAHSVACWTLVREGSGIDPVVMSGHSLGEISALVAAGALSFAAALTLVARRAEAMAACPPGGMSVVFGLPVDRVEAICTAISDRGLPVALANRNSFEQAVVSGHRAALAEAARALEDAGAVVRPIPVSIAAHSVLMASAATAFAAAVRSAAMDRGRTPVLSCITDAEHDGGARSQRLLVSQLTRCVDWPGTLRQITDRGVDLIIEMGPKTVLRDLIRTERPELPALSADRPEAITAAVRALQRDPSRSGPVDVARAAAFLRGCLRIAAGTAMTKNLSADVFEQAVRSPYRQIQADLDETRATAVADTAALRRCAARTLRLLHVKGVDERTGQELFAELVLENRLEALLSDYVREELPA